MLIKKRRYGRNEKPVAATGATHIIKIGFNAAQKQGEIQPGKLNGFVIYRDALDNNNQFLIDFQAMARLGYTAEQIQQAKQQGFKADLSLLPQELHFVIMADAKPTDNGFLYPGTFEESYECYNKIGLFCSGNGDTASRKLDDGSKRQIPCNPFGKLDIDPSEFCEYSGPGKACKSHYRLILCLLFRDPATNQMRPLVPELGMQAKYRFDSSSEYGAMGILDELDRAAERLNGRINGITGTISFQKKGRRTGNEKFSKSIVGHVFFQLHEESIRAKEQILSGNQLITSCIPQIEVIQPTKQIVYQKPAAIQEPQPNQFETDITAHIDTLKDDEVRQTIISMLDDIAAESDQTQKDILINVTEKAFGKPLNDVDEFYQFENSDKVKHTKSMKCMRKTLLEIYKTKEEVTA